MVYESVRYAVWGQGYGDYERRSGTGVASSGPLIGGGGGNAAIPVDLGRNTTAEIAASPCGRFPYVSNRGQDSVVVFQVTSGTGRSLRPSSEISAMAMS